MQNIVKKVLVQHNVDDWIKAELTKKWQEHHKTHSNKLSEND